MTAAVTADTKRRAILSARMLGSPNEGERAGAALALGRLVPGDMLADALDRGLMVVEPGGDLHWWTVAQTVVAYTKALTDLEMVFVVDMAMRNTAPSVQREKWLRSIYQSLRARGLVQ